MHPNVYSSNVHNGQTMEKAQMSNDRGTDKEDVVCVCISISIDIDIHTHTQWYVTQPSKK